MPKRSAPALSAQAIEKSRTHTPASKQSTRLEALYPATAAIMTDDDQHDSGEESPPELEVETHLYKVEGPRSTAVNIKLSITEGDEVPDMEILNVVATNEKKETGASAEMIANIFYRDKWPREEFSENMDVTSQETSDLASELFDDKGRLKKEFMNDPARKGSGIFSDKNLGSGAIVHIDRIFVPSSLRRKGVGKRMVELMQAKFRRKGVKWLFTWPNQLNGTEGAGEDSETHERNKQIAISFWRSVGFRRFGTTHWFCYAMEPKHKSRKIAAADDFDQLEGAEQACEDEDDASPDDNDCTCGKCIDGFISPRMKFTLSTHASVFYDSAHDSGDLDWFFDFCMVPRARRFAQKSKDFQRNCLETQLWISECLEMDLAPNTENIRRLVTQRHSPVYSRFNHGRQTSSAMVAQFLSSGGTVPEVMNIVLGFAYDQDEHTGDGEFMEIHGDQVRELPQCQNDGDFDMIKTSIA